MKFQNHIRIRVPKILDEKIEKALSKTESKSDFIRSAITEKLNKIENDTNRNNRTS
jgi:Arc/MetJ-type ribon-helix-helix transcriptional regulator